MVRILHLTDFHLNQNTLKDWKNYIREALLNKIRSIDKKRPITFIAFTGDLVDMGGSDFENIEVAFETFKREIITPIIMEVGFDVEKFLMVPGNHDIVRDLDHKRIEIGNQYYFKEKYTNISDFIINAVKKSDYQGMERIKPYKEFENKLYNGVNNYKYSILGSSYKFKVEDQNIGICCLNSSWRCYDKNDFGKLIVGEDQLVESFNYIKDCTVKIALLHHPLDWLIEEERGIIASHLSKYFDVLLMGHVHENKTSIETGFTGTLFKNVAPSGLNDIRSDSRKYSNGFTVIDYDKDGKEIICAYYRYNHDSASFVLNTDLGEEGVFTYSIPTKNSKRNINIENTLIENIKEDHFFELDERLIGTKATTLRPSIKEAFILPPIIEGMKSDDGSDNNTDVTFEEIMKAKSNLIFFGDQETGKTTLLFRILRQFVDEYSYLQKVPVYVDLNELGNKEFSTVIKEYLRCGTEDVNLLLASNKLVLLIDNLNFKTNEQAEQRNRLNRLNKNNEELQIIASSENLTPGILPIEYLELNKIPFRNFFIKSLRAKEIKSIMKMWLPEETELNSDLKLEKLVSSFNSYALPSSAMSVSLFLWSTEYSDRKPINNAVLMEIYIEILLQKLGKHNIYRETFDFTNKVQLLSKIAQEMLFKNEPSYSLLFSDFQGIVEKYLSEEVSFGFDASVIVNYFLERKLFIKYQYNRIKFSYSCFFHFFLAKRMIYSQSFKAYLIDETRYFKFYKEIDYYTGLTRSDEEFLKLILDRFEAKFKSTDEVYDSIDFDKYFTEEVVEEGEEHQPVVKDLDEVRIRENRPTDEMMEAFYNERLNQLPSPGVINKSIETVTFQRLLIIMGNVLRNSEGVENKALKLKAYSLQVKYSLTWMILYRENLIRYVIEHEKLPASIPQHVNFISFIKYFPVSVQNGMNNHIGTPKLSQIILEKIEKDLKNIKISNLENFLSVLLYADIQGRDFPRYLKRFVKGLNKNVVRDYTVVKLIDYYYRRTRPNSTNEQMYLDLISDLRLKTMKLPQRLKETVIRKIQDAKKAFEEDEK